MKRFSLRSIPVVLSLMFLASCNGSSGGSGFIGNLPGPSTQTTFSRMYDGVCTADAKIFVMASPAAPLTPTAAFPVGCSNGFSFNLANGQLADALGNAVKIFNPPYTSASTPAVTITGGSSTLSGATNTAWDGSGDVWVADASINQGVKEFAPPFTAGEAPAAVNTDPSNGTDPTSIPQGGTGLQFVGIAINPSAGLMFAGTGNSHWLYVIPAPYTGIATAVFKFGTNNIPYAVAVDQLGRLFVGFTGGGTLNGLIRVYTPPFATGNAAAFTLNTASGAQGVRALAFDPAQNLYAQLDNSTAVVFTGPVLGPYAAPSALLGCPTTSAGCGVSNSYGGLGFGP